MSKSPVSVRIISDIACPWCFVGLRNLLKASNDANIPVRIHWEPFFLNPDHPEEEGENILVHLKKKYGPSIESRIPQLEAAGRNVGISFTRNRNTVSTVKGHSLVEYAYKNISNEAGNQLMETIFKKYFENGENVSSDAVLSECAAEAGLSNVDEIINEISSKEYGEEVKRKAAKLQSEYRG